MRTILVFFVLAVFACGQEPVRYKVKFPAPETHYLEVTASVPAAGASVEVFMPVWTPGSYLVREYARFVEGFKARDAAGRELAWEKTRKNRWKVATGGAGRVELSYRVYAHEASVQGNWVDAGYAMLNGAPNFMTVVGGEKRRYEVALELAAGWKLSVSGLKAGAAANSYVAEDYDELVDCPIYAGNGPVHEFTVEGKKHYLVNEGEGPLWDGPASAAAVAKIVAYYSKMWGGLPYEKYVFFNMLTGGGGGLEHRNSTWLGASRWAWANAADGPEGGSATGQPRGPSRNGWLGLVSHEYVHLWNVKRLRPVELGPFDYENETYTKSLWQAEGLTSYYGPLAMRRAGLTTDAQLLRAMGGTIGALQGTPGRLVTPVEAASYNAWIGLYRPTENSSNTTISYYTKGAVIGLVLDAKIRKATGGKRSLDDVMRTAYARYGGARGFTAAEYRAVVSEVAGVDLSGWLKNALETTEELDYTEMLEWYGLRFRSEGARGGARVETGLQFAPGGVAVSGVRRGTAAYEAGLNVGDEVLAVNGYRVRGEGLGARLELYPAGTVVEVLVARREELKTLKLRVATAKAAGWALEVRPDASEEQKAHLKAWMGE